MRRRVACGRLGIAPLLPRAPLSLLLLGSDARLYLRNGMREGLLLAPCRCGRVLLAGGTIQASQSRIAVQGRPVASTRLCLEVDGALRCKTAMRQTLRRTISWRSIVDVVLPVFGRPLPALFGAASRWGGDVVEGL